MAKVTIIDSKTGEFRSMERRFADVLVKLRRATWAPSNGEYLTRDLVPVKRGRGRPRKVRPE